MNWYLSHFILLLTSNSINIIYKNGYTSYILLSFDFTYISKSYNLKTKYLFDSKMVQEWQPTTLGGSQSLTKLLATFCN